MCILADFGFHECRWFDPVCERKSWDVYAWCLIAYFIWKVKELYMHREVHISLWKGKQEEIIQVIIHDCGYFYSVDERHMLAKWLTSSRYDWKYEGYIYIYIYIYLCKYILYPSISQRVYRVWNFQCHDCGGFDPLAYTVKWRVEGTYTWQNTYNIWISVY